MTKDQGQKPTHNDGGGLQADADEQGNTDINHSNEVNIDYFGVHQDILVEDKLTRKIVINLFRAS